MFTAGPGFFGSSGGIVSPAGNIDAYTAGLATCWSVRLRLTSYYGGPLIRVRRSSDNAELDIGHDSSGALDAATLATFVGAGTGYVTKYYDQSGNTNDLVNGSGSTTQPRITESGSYVGSVHFAAAASCFMQSTGNCPATASISTLGWLQFSGSSGTYIIAETTDGSGTGDQFAFYNDGIGYLEYLDDGSNIAQARYGGSLNIGKTFACIADRTQTGVGNANYSNKVKYAESGSLVTPSDVPGSTGTVSTSSVFTAAPWNIGARNGASFFADIYVASLVTYGSSQLANLAAISTQLAVL